MVKFFLRGQKDIKKIANIWAFAFAVKVKNDTFFSKAVAERICHDISATMSYGINLGNSKLALKCIPFS